MLKGRVPIFPVLLALLAATGCGVGELGALPDDGMDAASPDALRRRDRRPDAGGTAQDAGGTAQDAGGTAQDAGGTTQDAGGATQDAGGTTQDAGGTTQDAGPALPFDVLVDAGSDLAAAVAAAPVGARIGIAPGLYRLAAPIRPKDGQALIGVVGQTIIDGAVVIASASFSGTNAPWFASAPLNDTPETATTAVCEDTVNNPCYRQEEVWYDGARLVRVMSLADGGPGRFFQDYPARRLYLWDPPAGHMVEMSKAVYAIADGLNPAAANDVTLQGLTVQHFASRTQKGAVLVGGSRWRILDNVLWKNFSAGLLLAGAQGAQVRGNTFAWNSQIGACAYGGNQVFDVLFEQNEFHDNNAGRLFYVADWESGGFKATHGGGVFRQNNVHDEHGVGVWVDVNGKGWTIESNRIDNAYAGAIRYEISFDGIIRNNTITRSGLDPGARAKAASPTGWYGAAGTSAININTSTGVQISGNTIGANCLNGIVVEVRSRTQDAANNVFGSWDLKNIDVFGNDVLNTFVEPSSAWPGKSGILAIALPSANVTGVLADYLNPASAKSIRFHDNTYRLDAFTTRRFVQGIGWSPNLSQVQYAALGWETGATYLIAP